MTDRAKLTAELSDVRRVTRVVGLIVWAVAVAVMIYGIPIVYTLLVEHQVPAGIAWLLSPAVDGALAVGLVATAVLARYNQPYGWVGAIRWVAGFTTWALNTAGPWTHEGGIDWLGVGTHTAGPLILFVMVEGAAQFQHRMGKVIAAKEAALKALDDKAKSEQARLTELNDRVNRLTSDLKAAGAREQEYAERVATLTATGESETADLNAQLEALKAEADTLRVALNEASDRAVVELNETVNALKVKHNEAMARLRAETSTVNLNSYRSSRNVAGGGRSTSASTQTGTRSRISEEDALQKLLAEHNDPDYEWSQAEVRRLTGVGFPVAKRLIAALNEHHINAATLRGGGPSGTRNVETAGDLSDDDKEDSRGRLATISA